MDPVVFAVITKMPKGAIFISRLVILERVDERPLSSSTKGLFLSSPIKANPINRQNRTMPGMSPSERDLNGLDGMKSSIRSVPFAVESWVVLKKEVFCTLGNANCIKKKTATPKNHISSMINAAFLRKSLASA